MGEDRRPNVAGAPIEEADQPQKETWSDERLRLEAKRLQQRSGVDGHERKPAPEDDKS